MEFLWFVGAIIVIAAAWGLWEGGKQRKKDKSGEAELSKRFPKSKVLFFSQDRTYCAVDEGSEKVILGEDNIEKIAAFSEIVSVDVITDGVTISSTNRGSQLLGAAVGGLAFGGVGAIIGGLSGSSKTSEKVKKLALRVCVDDFEKPIYGITFF